MPFYWMAVRPWVHDVRKTAYIETAGGKRIDLSGVTSVNDLMHKKAMPIRNISFRYDAAASDGANGADYNEDDDDDTVLRMMRDETLGETLARQKRQRKRRRKAELKRLSDIRVSSSRRISRPRSNLMKKPAADCPTKGAGKKRLDPDLVVSAPEQGLKLTVLEIGRNEVLKNEPEKMDVDDAELHGNALVTGLCDSDNEYPSDTENEEEDAYSGTIIEDDTLDASVSEISEFSECSSYFEGEGESREEQAPDQQDSRWSLPVAGQAGSELQSTWRSSMRVKTLRDSLMSTQAVAPRRNHHPLNDAPPSAPRRKLSLTLSADGSDDNSDGAEANLEDNSDTESLLDDVRLFAGRLRRKPERKRSIQWGHIKIREYPVCLGDNPACSAGAPIQLDWRHHSEDQLALDDFEQHRGRQRSLRRLSSRVRHQLLSELGYSLGQMKHAISSKVNYQKQRSQTVSRLKFMKFDEQVEKVLRVARPA